MTTDNEDKRPDKRRAPYSYRPPASLAEEFARRVERSGLSVNGYITERVFAGEVPRQRRAPPVEKQMLARLLFEVAGLRDELRDIASQNPEEAEGFESACQDIAEIRAVVLSLMERAP